MSPVRNILFLLIVLLSYCNLPKQPDLSEKEIGLINEFENKYGVVIERHFSTSYLRYQHKGNYVLVIKCKDDSMYNFLSDSGRFIAYTIYDELLSRDSNISNIEYHFMKEKGGMETYESKYLSFNTDSLKMFRRDSSRRASRQLIVSGG